MAEVIYRAGLVPVYVDDEGELHMLFMKPSDSKYGGSEYQIAKGRIEKDELPYETAIRESEEELGFKESNAIQIFDCGRWLGRTFIYGAIIKDKDDFGEFHFETESTKWFTVEEFLKDGRDIHKDIVRHIDQLTQMVLMYETH